ncbi:MAG: IS91 family transposase [Nitrospinae bacterium]|nr:IS91 family transposase [Nitrospinota bacterium]
MRSKPPLEVADIFRLYADDYIQKYTPPIDHLKVMTAITSCRTAKLGGHVDVCSEGCGYQRIAYNSCRNRHCPKCQFSKALDWIQARKNDLLAVPYFHVVFTLPTSKLIPIILPNKKVFYTLMFQSVSETLKTLGSDPKWLGANIGAICVLHTWTQKMAFHPHIHCIVPSGGLSDSGDRWVSSRNPDFFVPFKVLAKLFRGKLLNKLSQLNGAGKLSFLDQDHHLQHPAEFNRFCQSLYQKEWIAYAKPAFNGPHSVIQYLGQYVHKIAISNWRLVSLNKDIVTFLYRDRVNGNTKKTTPLHVFSFMKLFLQHVLPYRFTKIRSYGFLSNHSKKKQLAQARSLLPNCADSPSKTTPSEIVSDSIDPQPCPNCQKGVLLKLLLLPSPPKNTRSP